MYRSCPQEKMKPVQNCEKWNSTSWWTKYSKKTEIIYRKQVENKYANYVNTDIHYLSTDGDWIRKKSYLAKSLFCNANLHVLRRDIFN